MKEMWLIFKAFGRIQGKICRAFGSTVYPAEIDETAIQARLATELAAFKRPKRIIAIDALPRNFMGKI